MKRRHLIQGSALLLSSGLAANIARKSFAQTSPVPAQGSPTASPPTVAPTNPPPAAGEGLSVQWLHHSCVLLQTSAIRILINPFRPLGCTAGYPAPAVQADLVLLSSRLFDEGALDVVSGNPRVLFEPGDYQVEGIRIQGVKMAHDNTTTRGDRFGLNVAWRAQLGGLDVVHLGGAAAPITREQSILLSQPDLMFVPVGGGPKNYDPAGAQAAIQELQPKLVVPTMYRSESAASDCELVPLQSFLDLFPATVQPAPSNPLLLSAQSIPTAGPILIPFDL